MKFHVFFILNQKTSAPSNRNILLGTKVYFPRFHPISRIFFIYSSALIYITQKFPLCFFTTDIPPSSALYWYAYIIFLFLRNYFIVHIIFLYCFVVNKFYKKARNLLKYMLLYLGIHDTCLCFSQRLCNSLTF